jgi:hypothetical protein
MDGALDSPNPRRIFWIAIGLGPACWFGALLLTDALQPLACEHLPWLPPWIAGCFAVPVAMGLVAAARALAAQRNPTGLERLIGSMGVLMPALFAIALLWMVFGTAIFRACQ